MILAKSNGISLSIHSKNVSETAEKLMKKVLYKPEYINTDIELFEISRIGGLMHDIAKSISTFQKMLKKEDTEDNQKNKFRHNEIGWAFLYTYLNVEKTKLDLILDMVYWHHGISNKLNDFDSDQILDSIPNKDVEILTMKKVLVELLGQDYLLNSPRCDNYGKKTPLYYNIIEDNNDTFTERTILCRSCLISADRLISNLEEFSCDYNIDDEISKITTKNKFTISELNRPSHYIKSRFDKQIEISNSCGKTTIVKGPGGFGKTLLGMIWTASSDKKALWVCPRNGVAESAYISIKNEIDALGLNIKIELFLTGEVKDANYDIKNPFTSDIIITNIDNFLSPTVSTRFADRLFLINVADVIFDEFHELVSEAALFACFVNIMKVRHLNTDSRTVLLSATPIKMDFLWNKINNNTLILPDDNTHYNAAHNRLTNVNVIECLPPLEKSNSLYLMNAISNSQEYKNQYKCDDLIHSGFIDSDKDLKIKNLYNLYGKHSQRNIPKGNIMGTRIIQASFDISFQKVFESVLSPEATMQAYPRGDRWGDYSTPATYTTFRIKDTDVAENKVRDILYSKKLTDTWFDYFKQFNGTQMTLNDLYCEYNTFSKIYATEIKSYIQRKFRESVEKLSKIYPNHFKVTKKSKIKTAGGNKLRTIGNEIFVITKYYNSNTFTDPISTRIYKDFDKDFKETPAQRGRILGAMKAITESGDTRFDYEDIINNKKNTLDDIRKCAIKSNTPYIRFDKVYHPKYGNISEDRLNNLK